MAAEMREEMQVALTELTSDHGPALEPPRDPFTGQPMDKPPARAKTGVDPVPEEVETDPEVVADQIRQAGDLIRLLQTLNQDDEHETKQDEFHDQDVPNVAPVNHQPIPTS